jgi:hypothetical protein
MSVSFPTGYPEIDKLFAELSTLVHEHGKDSLEVGCFIEQHRDVTWVDKRSNETAFFEETAKDFSILFEGIDFTNDPKPPDPTEAADYWKTGDNPFESSTDDPADWWKQ